MASQNYPANSYGPDHFSSRELITVRVESLNNPISAKSLDRIQQPYGLWTTRLGRYSYTVFTFWQEAYQFYCALDKTECEGGVIRTYPIYHPKKSYADYMEELVEDSTYFDGVILNVPNSQKLDETCSDLLLEEYQPPAKMYFTTDYARSEIWINQQKYCGKAPLY